jgi:UDP-N-acetylmuramoylalanine--D-glutamate ligase|tara:strand:+ start:510 stop:1844 length:1335 start_codon:yes stop_codon:yes gene_type:complete
MKFEGKNIGIVGLGKSGYWASKLAKNLHYNVFVSDTNSNIDVSIIDDLENLGVEIELGEHTNKILDSDIIIKSPGIPNDIKILKKIEELDIPIISEIEFAGMISNVKNICITGTNGKTTTVSLIDQILKEELNVLKSGNIGIPFSQIVLENKLYNNNDIDYCILELSSFQLEHCSHLEKEISAFINISIDHMDRYESFDDYFNAKLKIFENSKYCLFNDEDKILKERIEHDKFDKESFSTKENKGNFFFEKNKIFSNDRNISIHEDEISIKGIHNISNIMVAAEIAYKVGIKKDNIFKAIKNFKGLEHRFEFLKSFNSIDYINDSKSTNVDSTVKALKSITKKVVLILGGIPKENDFNDILLHKSKILKIVVYGEAKDMIYDSLSQEVEVLKIHEFDDAVHLAIQNATKDSVVLLSPACASFDQFNSYEERGIKYKNIIERFYA